MHTHICTYIRTYMHKYINDNICDYSFILFYYRSDSPEHVIAVSQEIQGKPKFIDIEGTGMLLDTLAKNMCKYI